MQVAIYIPCGQNFCLCRKFRAINLQGPTPTAKLSKNKTHVKISGSTVCNLYWSHAIKETTANNCSQEYYTLPKPKELSMHISILALNCSSLRRPNVLGKVILRSHVDARGRQVSSVKQIVGGEGNPVAGILDEPEKN